ncbi:MAG: cysteine desulfurase family protein [Christiangramia sp.]|uniref:cysteine desulfurase family protein n=1 Tax=Christiangramia sp. TaxID=1931228 RepID=UPI0032423A10
MSSGELIYLDYNATTPLDQRVLDSMLPFFTEYFGNPSSDHVFGWQAAEAVEHSREQIARLVHCRPADLTFTSGATEAANMALFGFCEKNGHKGKHIISCKTEHKAVLDCLQALEKSGCRVSYLDVDSDGNIDLEQLQKMISSETILVNLMLANNETGIIQPMKEISEIVHRHQASMMSDITQAVGKIPVNLEELNLDVAFFSAHKMYGPKGIGALYINKKNKVRLGPRNFGGQQEKGMRPGTLNVPGIVGFGKAAEVARADMKAEADRLQKLRKQLESGLKRLKGARINSYNSRRLPNTTNISFEGIDGQQLIRKLKNLAVSRGSACSANEMKASHVLKAMRLSEELALSSLRISLGKFTTSEEIDKAIAEITKSVQQLKKAEV